MRCIFLFLRRKFLLIHLILFLHNNRFSSHGDTECYHSYKSPHKLLAAALVRTFPVHIGF
jgi:hypothetical protein